MSAAPLSPRERKDQERDRLAKKGVTRVEIHLSSAIRRRLDALRHVGEPRKLACERLLLAGIEQEETKR